MSFVRRSILNSLVFIGFLSLLACGSQSSDPIEEFTGSVGGNPIVEAAGLIRQTTFEDTDADGVYEYSFMNTFDSQGRTLEYEYDYGGDGSVDLSYVNIYDTHGLKIQQDIDGDGDGTLDDIRYYGYDHNANIIKYENDSDADGSIDAVYTYEISYDDSDRMVESKDYRDGNFISISRYTYALHEPTGLYEKTTLDYSATDQLQSATAEYYASESYDSTSLTYEYEFQPSQIILSVYTREDQQEYVQSITHYAWDYDVFSESDFNAQNSLSEWAPSETYKVYSYDYAYSYDAKGIALYVAEYATDHLDHLKTDTLSGMSYSINTYSDGAVYSYVDEDLDGFPLGIDCNDTVSSLVYPETEICDGIDNDCDGLVDEDLSLYSWGIDEDGDGFYGEASVESCEADSLEGYIRIDSSKADCDDGASHIHPYAIEIQNGVDDNCNGAVDEKNSSDPFFGD